MRLRRPSEPPPWHLHLLRTGGDMADHVGPVRLAAEAARAAIHRIVPCPALDLLLRRAGPEATLPDLGLAAVALEPRLMALNGDPSARAFGRSLHDGALVRVLVHEAHHCLRMAGPGYGRTLGEALVSEGLAGAFVSAALGTVPEPWEDAVGEATLLRHWPAPDILAAPCDHGRWFAGTGDLPLWIGYALGYRIASRWAMLTRPKGRDWTEVSARAVIETAALA
ncbi:DUF2268 domain-containing protein [Jannaschia sp. W003]|uniref:DUF2268 domain-containing protein n=1 Tax=Jannaschia sp. W003 TaxID=2867012 RepID=UPI0021A5A36F|nr:DUF2268 domain-containing protein [Jannaschia sp. W003]UWQ21624.1 DUF2268 domain-containing protein [Jannaschia sp. W003]